MFLKYSFSEVALAHAEARITWADPSSIREGEMYKSVLVGVIVAGMLAPLVWLNPFRYFQEKKAIRDILQRHPTIRLRKLEIASRAQVAKIILEADLLGNNEWSHGIILEIGAPTVDEMNALTSFHRAIRCDPILEVSFKRPEMDVLNGGWRVYDPAEPPNPDLDLRFVFIPKPKEADPQSQLGWKPAVPKRL